MSKARLKSLQEEALAFVKKAREIAEKAQAEGREMSDDEGAEYKSAMERSADLLEQIKAVKRDVEILEKADEMAAAIGLPTGADEEPDVRARAKSLGLQIVESPQFKSAMAQFKGGRVPDRSSFSTAPIEVKGLFTGASDTSAGAFVVPEQTGIVEMLGRKELTIRDLISVRRTGSDTVEYVQQTSHTNAAAPVPEATTTAAPSAEADTDTGEVTFTNAPGGGYKPEGSWAFERKTAVVKTIAEWVPATKRALADAAALEGLINDELRADILEAEENQILNGNGSGENLTGINSWSGVQTQSYSTDLFTTIRKAITKARTVGRVAPNAIVVNPVVAEAIDLLKDGEDRYYFGGPSAIGQRTLWGVPVVESETQPVTDALVGDFSKAVLWDREQTTVTVTDSHADFFIRNMVAILAEERVAFAVTRPTAFVKAGTNISS